jgi:hypothetical protein
MEHELMPLFIREVYEDDTFELAAILATQEEEKSMFGRGSRVGRSPNLRRDFASAHQQLMDDYFAENPVYPDEVFERRFRMSRQLFMRICDEMKRFDRWFDMRYDALKKPGLSTLQKCTAAMRMLAYGLPADAVDEYVKIGESTANFYFERFCDNIISMYGDHFLRKVSPERDQEVLLYNANRGLPGLYCCLDNYNWVWDNCPKAWAGQFIGKDGVPCVKLESACHPDLYTIFLNFGDAGSLNDINTLQRSPFNKFANQGVFSDFTYVLNGKQRTGAYSFVDGIYPPWKVFAKTISEPRSPQETYYAKVQEGTRKDIERSYGTVQKRFSIVRQPARCWYIKKMRKIITSCFILQNMIIRDKQSRQCYGEDRTLDPLPENLVPRELPQLRVTRTHSELLDRVYAQSCYLRNEDEHNKLRRDLIAHLWQWKSNH